MLASLRNQIRGMIHARKERALPRRGSKPPIGTQIACGDVRMTIQAGMSDEMWQWLLEEGWREPTYRPDRRRYRDVPSAWVTRLIDAVPTERSRVLQAATQKAIYRPTLRRTNVVPAYVERG